MPLTGWEKVSREDEVYKACLTVSTAGGAIVGGMTGSFLGPAGTVSGYLGGAAWGFAAGYLACPFLVPPIKSKIERRLDLSEAEVREAAEAMGRYALVSDAGSALRLLAVVIEHTGKPGAQACPTPQFVARQLLPQNGLTA